MLKRSFDSNYCQCKFAVMNPELTYTLPAYQTASGCVDIMMHTMERYFSVDSMHSQTPCLRLSCAWSSNTAALL